MGDSFHLHYQAGSSNCIGCTIFMDVCLLDSEARCSKVLSSWFYEVVSLGGGAVNHKKGASISILFASMHACMHACACEQCAQVGV